MGEGGRGGEVRRKVQKRRVLGAGSWELGVGGRQSRRAGGGSRLTEMVALVVTRDGEEERGGEEEGIGRNCG